MRLAKSIVLIIAIMASMALLTSCFSITVSKPENGNDNAINAQAEEGNTNYEDDDTVNVQEPVQTVAEPVVQGTYYQYYPLVDPQLNAAVFNAFLPQGWTGNVSSNWSVICPDFPGLEEITLMSPDGQAMITIDSAQSFTQNDFSGKQGPDFSTYTTYANYMDAPTYTDTFIANAYPGASLAADLSDDPETLDMLRQYNDLIVQNGQQTMDTVTAGGTIGANITITPLDSTFCKRQYQANGSYIETTCPIVSFQQTFYTSYLTDIYIHWRLPYSIVYQATDKAAFDAHYSEYEMIVANSMFTPDYYAAEEYVASCIGNNLLEAQNAANQGTSSYSSSGYESTSGDSTNEKIINMWDDVINEVDSYNTLDGGTIKTSMYNDIVAQDGDSYFVGSSTSDIPYGYTELSKSY